MADLSGPGGSGDTGRQWALVLMGAWLMGSIVTSMVATQNFYTIDRLLAASPNASFAHAVSQLGQPQARDLLRYLSSELNRLYFQLWNAAQLALGVVVIWLIARASGGHPLYTGRAWRAVAAMLVTVLAMLVWLTPAVVSLGRSLDFVPRDSAPPGMQRFWVLHGAYTSLEMLKLAIGFAAAWWIVKASGGAARLTADHAGQVRGAPLVQP